jgi:hypothetical protein
MRLLLSWVGSCDLEKLGHAGPIFDIIRDCEIEKAIFLFDHKRSKKLIESGRFAPNLKKNYPKVHMYTKRAYIDNPSDLDSIYEVTQGLLKCHYKSDVYVNLSSGSGCMCAAWVLAIERICKDKIPTLIETSTRNGTRIMKSPFKVNTNTVQ